MVMSEFRDDCLVCGGLLIDMKETKVRGSFYFRCQSRRHRGFIDAAYAFEPEILDERPKVYLIPKKQNAG